MAPDAPAAAIEPLRNLGRDSRLLTHSWSVPARLIVSAA
ncbi:hypothetical protein NSU_1910 [Novosphingobium pentaromativorans US6-1]|uniref:Uncharacterized protein n=1 Tax=Novosphingobium pentaromativorans US6-1 TaxID=1088721 RepID=G6EC39_9SPHN|nr:hypothetical protein NSU_1910 [Novosphingobium pentaromativorans US6-1]